MTVHVGWIYGYRLAVGGVEQHLLSLLRHAPQKQYRFTFIGHGSADFRAQARSLGAQWIEWHTANALDLRALTALIAENSFELFHTHSPNAMLVAGIAACWRHRPHILTVQIPVYEFLGEDDWRRSVYQFAEGVSQHRLAQAVIYASQRTYATARQLGIAPAQKSWVIENGIELDQYTDAQSLTEPSPTICCVARLEYQKGLDVLLEALAQLPSETRVVIVGEGSQRASLEARARELQLGGRVTFEGHQSYVAHYLQHSQIFVLPSRFEGLAFALLEALAAGLPCVVTEVGDHGRLIISGENGLVVPPNDPTALAAALECLLRDPALRLRLGAAARRTVEAYSAERMAQRTFAVYEQVLNQWPHR